jgi:formylglycine-generating enzyme required for sulfatase activity
MNTSSQPRTSRVVLAMSVVVAAFAADACAVTITWSPVGNPGNIADTTVMYTDGTSGYGSVAYNYRIDTYDVTACQYAEFLNAKDADGTNALFLYSSKMSTSIYGNINLDAGNLPGAKYTPVLGRENLPVNFVSWYDAIRFANWLNNGQGNGDTETGAYTLGTLGADGVPVSPPLTHNTGSQVWLPTEDEWYKAAYYDPRTTAQGGPPSDRHYWLYPTSSNTLPTASSPTALPNHANYLPGGPGDLTDVGAYTGTTSPYGAFDMGGNVWQWNETLLGDSQRVFRGGSWAQASGDMLSSSRFGPNPSDEGHYFGFRVASVPEPSSVVLIALGILGLMALRKRRRSICAALMLSALIVFVENSRAVTIPTVAVGNAGNDNDVTGFGGVGENYRIGTTEVTNAQYTEFLNAKAAFDPLALYNTNMGINFLGIPAGIARSGSSPNFSYAAATGRGDMPVTWVSWYDSVRFANWLHNGQGNGATETGAYTLLGNGTPTPSNGASITRNAGAIWFLPSENEWYKAAYYDPRTTAQDGPPSDSHYWLYPTNSDVDPTAEAPAGGSNSANYAGIVGDLTNVGAYTGTTSPYGAFDMAGNVFEWNETVIGSAAGGKRGGRGGDYSSDSSDLQSSSLINNNAFESYLQLGFRVATVPEPSSLVLAALSLAALAFVTLRVRLRRG